MNNSFDPDLNKFHELVDQVLDKRYEGMNTDLDSIKKDKKAYKIAIHTPLVWMQVNPAMTVEEAMERELSDINFTPEQITESVSTLKKHKQFVVDSFEGKFPKCMCSHTSNEHNNEFKCKYCGCLKFDRWGNLKYLEQQYNEKNK